MTIYEYRRCSTDSQDDENQGHGTANYARARGWEITDIYRDTASGKTPWQERRLGAMLDELHAGDIILTAEISRLARSTLQVLEVMQEAAKRGLIIHVVKSNIVMDGSMQSRIMATVFGLVAEIEREFIQSRTLEALARRKASGLPMGRPPGESKRLKLDDIAKDIEGWHKAKISWANIAKLANCSRSTLYAWANRRHPEWITGDA